MLIRVAISKPWVYIQETLFSMEDLFMSRVPFNRRIAELRLARGLSLRQMAIDLEQYGVKVSHNAIAKWEAEKMPGSTRLPSQEVIGALCKLFNVKPSFLVEEMFAGVKTRSGSGRNEKMLDVELLTDEEFQALLKVKDLFIKARTQKTRAE
jgi:transcriptional regulator with XRE-family HTH domain